MPKARWRTWAHAFVLLVLASPGSFAFADPLDVDLVNYDYELNNGARLYLMQQSGRSDVYLFGTMHLSDPRLLDLPESVGLAFNSSAVLATESRWDPNGAIQGIPGYRGASSHREFRELCFGPTPLRTVVGFEVFERTVQAFDRLTANGSFGHFPVEAIDRLTPWCAGLLVDKTELEWRRLYRGALTLDETLVKRAAQKEKTIIRLESFEEQSGHVLDMPIELQIEHLEAVLNAHGFPSTEDAWQAWSDSYVAGRVPLGAAHGMASSEELTLYVWRYQILERNLRMAQRVVAIDAAGPIFVAVGFAHLIGEKGLVALLAEEGYEATALEPPR